MMFMIFVLMGAFGLSAVWGLVWAVRTGQFRNPGGAARSIFDAEEPIGQPTDAFPKPDKRVTDER